MPNARRGLLKSRSKGSGKGSHGPLSALRHPGASGERSVDRSVPAIQTRSQSPTLPRISVPVSPTSTSTSPEFNPFLPSSPLNARPPIMSPMGCKPNAIWEDVNGPAKEKCSFGAGPLLPPNRAASASHRLTDSHELPRNPSGSYSPIIRTAFTLPGDKNERPHMKTRPASFDNKQSLAAIESPKKEQLSPLSPTPPTASRSPENLLESETSNRLDRFSWRKNTFSRSWNGNMPRSTSEERGGVSERNLLAGPRFPTPERYHDVCWGSEGGEEQTAVPVVNGPEGIEKLTTFDSALDTGRSPKGSQTSSVSKLLSRLFSSKSTKDAYQ